MNEQSELTPKRRAEIKKMRLYLWLGVIGLSIGFACMWGAVKATQAVLPQPIGLPITLLWCASLWGWLSLNLFWHRRAMLQSYQQTEDAIALSDRTLATIGKALNELEQRDQIEERTFNMIEALIEDNRNLLDRITSPKRGRGRPELTIAEMRREIDRAEQKRAELQAQEHTPTEAEIARAIGLSPKTLQRYRDRVDNKGQK